MRKLIPALFLGLAAVVAIPTLALAQETSLKQVRGTINSINGDKNTFQMTALDKKAWTFQMAETYKVSVNDDKNLKLADLKKGDTVLCFYQQKGDDYICSEIRATRNGEQVQGTIQSIDKEKGTFVIKDKDDKSWDLHMGQNAFVGLGEKGNLKLEDLKVGDTVQCMYFTRDDHRYCTLITAKRKSE